MKTCIIITGPTAIGKTPLAIEVAKHFSTQIISADSRQCFQELDIGVSKPSADQLLSVPHYFINSHSIHQTVSAATFEEYALTAVNNIFLNSNYAVMAGGTGLYIKAFCEGLDFIPLSNETIRKEIIESYNRKGLVWLQNEVKKNDYVFFRSGEATNPNRLMRALEVFLSTGRSITSFQIKNKKKRDFNIIKIGLELDRKELYNRINNRVETMISSGLLDEVRSLQDFKHLNALQTVGYRELFSYLEGITSFDQAVELIKQNTRHYAKRQLTWFRKEEDMKWINALSEETLVRETMRYLEMKSE